MQARVVPPAPRDRSPGIHHVWVNATGNWAYFLDDVDRMDWIRLFAGVAVRYGWAPVAFCEVTTHVHAIVSVPDESLPCGMQYLSREYSKDFNARHDRHGYLVRRRYGSRRVEDGRDLLGVYRYVVLNPVEERMCRLAEDWRWSSFATTVGLRNDFAFVDARVILDELGGSVARLRALVATGAPQRGLFGHGR